MIAMIPKLAVLLLCASMVPASQAFAKSKAILPEGCGDDSVQFDVTQEKENPAFAAPPEGKAVIVFSESMPSEQKMKTTTRFGVDGTWAGATKGDSYFTLTVEPGAHNICASMQSAPSRMKKQFTQLATLTAEAGEVYYFEAVVNVMGTANLGFATFNFAQLSDADGKYRLKAWKFATSKVK
jgi:hypothetical protein